VRSHGIRTPDWFWKVVITRDAATDALRAIAWIIPNQADLQPLDSYLVSISQLQQWLSEQQVEAARLNLSWPPEYDTTAGPATTWPQPANCQLG
jgi:endonuclease G